MSSWIQTCISLVLVLGSSNTIYASLQLQLFPSYFTNVPVSWLWSFFHIWPEISKVLVVYLFIPELNSGLIKQKLVLSNPLGLLHGFWCMVDKYVHSWSLGSSSSRIPVLPWWWQDNLGASSLRDFFPISLNSLLDIYLVSFVTKKLMFYYQTKSSSLNSSSSFIFPFGMHMSSFLLHALELIFCSYIFLLREPLLPLFVT